MGGGGGGGPDPSASVNNLELADGRGLQASCSHSEARNSRRNDTKVRNVVDEVSFASDFLLCVFLKTKLCWFEIVVKLYLLYFSIVVSILSRLNSVLDTNKSKILQKRNNKIQSEPRDTFSFSFCSHGFVRTLNLKSDKT